MERRRARVEHAVQRFNAGDYGGFLEIFSPEALLLADPQVADRTQYRGRTGVAEWLVEAQRRWQAVRFEALALEPIDDALVVELAVIGDTAAGGGAWRLYVRLLWDGDLVTGVRAYPTRTDAFADPGMG
jgi:hypothetical protein